MSQKNEIKAEKLSPTTVFLPSDGASCCASSVYASKCFTFGRMEGNKPGFLTWWYSPNADLGNRSPRDATDAGDLQQVENLWDSRHNDEMTSPHKTKGNDHE
jgi:hypothetical protein